MFENPINNNNFAPFRFWCQKVLPLVYDDSLSYYELLCKVVAKLNEVIQNEETFTNAVTAEINKFETETNQSISDFETEVNAHRQAMQAKVNELEQFMNNYFNNLDVQQEINNKLDSMAASGQLSTLINPFVGPAVDAWLSSHITPTSPPLDSSFTLADAAAQAKAVGDKGVFYYGTLPSNITKLSDIKKGSIYNVNRTIEDWPIELKGAAKTIISIPCYNNFIMQIAFSTNTNVVTIYEYCIRFYRINFENEISKWNYFNLDYSNFYVIRNNTITDINSEIPIGYNNINSSVENLPTDFIGNGSLNVLPFSQNTYIKFVRSLKDAERSIFWKYKIQSPSSISEWAYFSLSNLGYKSSINPSEFNFLISNLTDEGTFYITDITPFTDKPKNEQLKICTLSNRKLFNGLFIEQQLYFTGSNKINNKFKWKRIVDKNNPSTVQDEWTLFPLNSLYLPSNSIAAIGDSITYGITSEKGPITDGWIYIIAACNLLNLSNYAVSGAFISKMTGQYENYSYYDKQVSDNTFTQDVICVMLGINDYWYNPKPLYDNSENISNDIFTDYYNATKKLLQKTTGIVCLITPFMCKNGTAENMYSLNTPSVGGWTLLELSQMIEKVGEMLNVSVINCTKISPFNIYNVDALIPDKTHPSAQGMKRFASFINHKLPL